MRDITVSIITVTYNAEKTIERCIRSVVAQGYPNIQYIIIDGSSTDSTLKIIDGYKDHISVLVSEPDKGIYDAMNKGLALAAGNVVGVLNADDYFADNEVINEVAEIFSKQEIDALYGHLDYVNTNGSIIRKWRSENYRQGLFNFGWMPPHPTFYCRRAVFDQFGVYDISYGTAADYELMLRFIHLHRVTVALLSKTMIKMSVGGVSNKSSINRLKAWQFDYKAMQKNGVIFPPFAIVCKPFRKVLQYFK